MGVPECSTGRAWTVDGSPRNGRQRAQVVAKPLAFPGAYLPPPRGVLG